MAEDGATEGQESLMNIGAPFVVGAQAAKLMPPTQGAFHDPAGSAQPATMRRARACQLVGDPARLQPAMVRGTAVGAITLHDLRPLTRATDLASHGGNSSHERLELATVMHVGRRQQVMPLPHPNSSGRSCQAMPLLSTNKIPVNAARAGTRWRPGN